MEEGSNFGPPQKRMTFSGCSCFLSVSWYPNGEQSFPAACYSHHDVLPLRPEAAGPEPVNSETV